MTKKVLVSVAAALAASLASQAHAANASCDDPLTSKVGHRVCERLFGPQAIDARNASFAERADVAAVSFQPQMEAVSVSLVAVAEHNAPVEGATTFARRSEVTSNAEAATPPAAPVAVVPEPSIYALLLGGLGIVLLRIFQAAR